MRIAHVTSEVAPWSHTGGLADVCGSLPAALERASDGVLCGVVSPLYRCVRERIAHLGVHVERHEGMSVTLGGERYDFAVATVAAQGAPPVHFIDAPSLYDRDGLYTDSRQRDYADNALRFAVLARASIAAAPHVMGGAPDVLHAHDWQAGLVPLYARAAFAGVEHPALVFTIHNLAYRGLFPKHVVPGLGLEWSVFTPDAMEFHDQASFLKAGVAFSDAVTTVSPSYAEEIQTPEGGQGLDAFMRHHADRLHGIVNGIDTDAWNPATDPRLAASYDAASMDGKRLCRRAVAAELGIEVGDRELLLGMVTRFAEQKGLDLVAELVPELGELGARLILLGTGDEAIEARFRAFAAEPDSRVAVRIAFDLDLARRIYAGADALLMPSRFEPCGLNQLYAMRYGTVPIVRAVGGLRDTVTDPGDAELARGRGTGFSFEHPDAQGLRWAVDRAARLFRSDPEAWRRVAAAGMRQDWSWTASAREYLALYRRASGAATV